MYLFFHNLIDLPSGLLILFFSLASVALVPRGVFVLLVRRPEKKVFLFAGLFQFFAFLLSLSFYVSAEVFKHSPSEIVFYPGFPFGLCVGLPFILFFELDSRLWSIPIILLNFTGFVAIAHFAIGRWSKKRLS